MDSREGPRSLEALDKFMSGSAPIFVQYAYRDIFHFQSNGIGKHDQLYEQRSNEHKPAFFVAPNRCQFFDNQKVCTSEHGSVQSLYALVRNDNEADQAKDNHRKDIRPNDGPNVAGQK